MRTYPISNPLEEKRVALEVLEDGRKGEEKKVKNKKKESKNKKKGNKMGEVRKREKVREMGKNERG